MDVGMGHSDRQVVDPAAVENAGEVPATESREAIVYVGPLALGLSPGKTVNGVVTRLTAACDRQSRTGQALWRTEWHGGAVTTAGGSEHPQGHLVAAIIRTDNDQDRAEFDVYEYAWSDHVRDSWEERNVLSRALLTLMVLIRARGFLAYFNKAPGRAEKGRLQLAIAILAIIAAAGYLAIVVWSFVDAVTRGLTEPISMPQWLTVVLTSAGIAGLPQLKTRFSTVGAGLVAMNTYLRTGDQRGRLMHGLADLAEQLREDDRYDEVTIIGYSFGSILAIDALFPKEHPPERSFEKVTKLVTIGSAYDFVLATAPRYLQDRHATEGTPRRWVNVYAPIDLLGSDFKEQPTRHDSPGITVARTAGPGERTHDVAPNESLRYDNGTHVDLANALALYGFVAHGAYWGPDDTPDRNVFSLILPAIYPDPAGPLR